MKKILLLSASLSVVSISPAGASSWQFFNGLSTGNHNGSGKDQGTVKEDPPKIKKREDQPKINKADLLEANTKLQAFQNKFDLICAGNDIEGLIALGKDSFHHALNGSLRTNEFAEIGFKCFDKVIEEGDLISAYNAAYLAYKNAHYYHQMARSETQGSRRKYIERYDNLYADQLYKMGEHDLKSKLDLKYDVNINYLFQFELRRQKANLDRSARSWFKQAADRGHTKAQLSYAKMCLEDSDGPRDLDEAAKYFKKAGEAGNVEAQFSYAQLCFNKFCNFAKEDEGIKWYEKAAEEGHLGAQIYLSKLFLYTSGSHYNYIEGCNWLQRAANNGDKDSQTKLANFLYHGRYFGQNYEAALYWYEQAAQQNSTTARYKVADMNFHGLGTPVNYQKARESFWEIATLEYNPYLTDVQVIIMIRDSQQKLGEIYRDGLGTPRSYTEAAYWFGKYYHTAGFQSSDSERNPFNFSASTLLKMDDEIEDKFYSHFRGNQYVSLAMFNIIQQNSFTYGKLHQILPHFGDLKNLYEKYVKKLNKQSTFFDPSPLQEGTHTYLTGLLSASGEEEEQVPQDVLRFYAILETLRKKHEAKKEDAFDFFKNQFCQSIINCAVGKGDSLMRFFITAVPDIEKSRYVSTRNANLEEHEVIVQNYLQTNLTSILEEVLADENFLQIITEDERGAHDPSHQTGYLRSCLGHHLGLERKYVFDEHTHTIYENLVQMSPTQMLEKFCDFVTPDTLCQRFKDKIDETLNDQSASTYYLPHFINYLGAVNGNFKVSYQKDVEKYEITPKATETLLLRHLLLREVEED